MSLAQLRVPIVQAPLAGGVSTPRLAAAVAEAGGLGFLAAGYKTAESVKEDMRELRSLTSQPFGVNIFVPPAPNTDDEAVARYAGQLQAEADRYDMALGEPRHDDDQFDAKLELVLSERVGIVSFTFGCPTAEVVERVRSAGCEVWVTVTNPDEARAAAAVGADVLVVQGFEAGGHRGYFVDGPEAPDLGLIALLRLVASRVELPLVAAGGIADGASVAAVLCAGAVAAQIGSALMLTPEAGTSEPHRAAMRAGGSTGLTRAFSGRQARGIVNRFMREHGDRAPIAYPDVHHLTAPLRASARNAADPDGVNLWAGQAYQLAAEAPAAAIVTELAVQARRIVTSVAERLDGED
jgi:nitronate monooxygenase